MKKESKVVVVGTRFSGLTSSRLRISDKPAITQLGFHKSDFEESQISDSVMASLPEIEKIADIANTRDRYVLFLNDYWKSVSENPPAWFQDPPFEKDCSDLRTFFERHKEVIRLLVKEEEAKKIINSYFLESHGISEANVRGFPQDEVLNLSRLKSREPDGKEFETYVPGVIIETIEKWALKNPIVIEKMRDRLKMDEEEIKSAFVNLRSDLVHRISSNAELLAVLGIASSSSNLLASSGSTVQAILKLLGFGAASASSLFGLPVTLGFLVASSFGLFVANKKNIPESQKMEFEKLNLAFLKAQDFWRNELTETQKKLYSYELDKKLRRPLGDSEKDLALHYMTSDERDAEWREFKDEIQSKVASLSIGQVLEINALLTPFTDQLKAVVEDVQDLKVWREKTEKGLQEQCQNFRITVL